jgi:hypothetical protein
MNTRVRMTGTPVDYTERLWAIVLAVGEGKRLAPLTRALYGRELPKQCAVLHRGRSLLQTTMDRVAPRSALWSWSDWRTGVLQSSSSRSTGVLRF